MRTRIYGASISLFCSNEDDFESTEDAVQYALEAGEHFRRVAETYVQRPVLIINETTGVAHSIDEEGRLGPPQPLRYGLFPMCKESGLPKGEPRARFHTIELAAASARAFDKWDQEDRNSFQRYLIVDLETHEVVDDGKEYEAYDRSMAQIQTFLSIDPSTQRDPK